MGTRHLIIVWYKGKYRIAQYGQWDGYPSGQGLRVLRFLKNFTDLFDSDSDIPEVPKIARKKSKLHNITALKRAIDDNMIYEPDEEEMQKFWKQCDKMDSDAKEQELPRRMDGQTTGTEKELFDLFMRRTMPEMLIAPTLGRDAGAKILTLVAHATKKVPVSLYLQFVVDYNLCEWAYILDLDENMLEIYNGPEKFHGTSTKGRFDMEEFVLNPQEGYERGYRPHLVKKYHFESLMDIDEKVFVAETQGCTC